jgi:hypothetical protein
MIDYNSFPGLAGVYLEDSYVLGISESSDQLVFHLDAVLTPEHAAYHPPRPGEQYCYQNGSLVFPGVTGVAWLRRNSSHYTDASGEGDLGNIDILTVDGDAVVVEGDWGTVRISGAQPRSELSDPTMTVNPSELPDISSYVDLIDRFVGRDTSAPDFEKSFLQAMKSERRTLGDAVYPILQELFEDADDYVEQAELRTETEDLDDHQLLTSALRARRALSGLGYA